MSKVGAIPKAQKMQFSETHKNFGTPKRAFRARKTIQKFGYSVLGQMRALLFEPPPFLGKTPCSSNITFKIRI